MGAGTMKMSKWGTNKKLWRPLSIISILVFVALSVFAFFYTTNLSKKIAGITAENVVDNVTLNDYTTKINNENMKNLEKIFTSAFTVDQLSEMAAKNFTYTLTINGKIHDKSNEAYINSSKVIIGLIETIADNKLPKSILDLGRVKIDSSKGDDYSSNITLTAKDVKFTKTKNEKNGITNIYYTAENLKVGTIITVFFSDELVQKMGLKESFVEIFYNK